MPLVKQLGLKYPTDHVTLFELGFKSAMLYHLYVPGNDLGLRIAIFIADRATTAQLPEHLWRPVVRKIDQRAKWEEVTSAVNKMIEDVSDYLEHLP